MRRTTKSLVAAVLLTAMVFPALPATASQPFLTARLSGANEVPANDSGAFGRVSIQLKQNGDVCALIRTTGYIAGDDDVIAGHIHKAAVGVIGPVVVDLMVTSANQRLCVSGVDPALLDDIRSNPADYYVNIHTNTLPGGEIRGQLG